MSTILKTIENVGHLHAGNQGMHPGIMVVTAAIQLFAECFSQAQVCGSAQSKAALDEDS